MSNTEKVIEIQKDKDLHGILIRRGKKRLINLLLQMGWLDSVQLVNQSILIFNEKEEI